MLKQTLLITIGAALGVWTPAWGVWRDDFDSYDTVTPLPDQSTWESWDGDPGAAQFFATADRARSMPNSCAIDDNDDAVHQYAGYTSGFWVYTAWQFIPTEMDDIQYFILLNTYPANVSQDWSMQIECDGSAGEIRDFNGDETLPMVKGAWVEIRDVIDLDNDVQSVYYNDTLLVTKSWSEGVAPGGAVNIAAVDLWGNGSAYAVYYDDMRLAEEMALHGSPFGPPDDGIDPIGPWHELWPVFCQMWECTKWKDNGSGELDACDYLWLEMPLEEPGWWHVENVTVTVVLEWIEGVDLYLDWQGPWSPYDEFNPIGPWHEIYPTYCTPWKCVDWIDNGNGILDFCDWLVFETPEGPFELHVLETAVDIDVVREDPPVDDHMWLDGPDLDRYAPVYDPTGPWHELWPDFCTPWECTDWIDNGNGILDYCDYLWFEMPDEDPAWWHVENVTITVVLELMGRQEMYLDWLGPPPGARFDPVGPWHEIYPNFCTPWNCIDWVDTDGDDLLGFCDWMVFELPDGTQFELHVLDVGTDIDVVREDPPIEDEMWLDGPDFDPYKPVEDPTGPWHELWPAYCTPWECPMWKDNGNGYLDYCDYLWLETPDEEPGWWHVENVTITVVLELMGRQEMYLDWLGPPPGARFDPVGPWHEIYPNFCTPWNCIDWVDTDGDDLLGFCDWMVFELPDGTQFELHVLGVATDIDVVKESPPCPADINGDGVVDVLDLLGVLAAWGTTGDVPEDVNDDGVVDVLDLIEVLSAWGPCD